MKILSVIAICILLTSWTSAGPARGRQRSNRPKVQLVDPDTLDNVADETLSLITTGKDKIHLADNLKEVVLVVGNTGVGKTTLSKFITGQKLSAYKSGSRYLIKDIDGKISLNSTMISKTIYPDVFQDEAGTVYYDLPGFSDTRNASIELANSWFMKMVADHVDRVKILCIVNFSSLKTGESRTDFKSFLEHIIKFVVDPAKFTSSIALVASKVEHNLMDEDAVAGIVDFLIQANDDIEGLFLDDDDKLEKAQEIIEAFLHQDSTGKYDRIGFFKQPGQEGEFDNIAYFVGRRKALRKMVDRSLDFTSKNDEDFGISVSESAVLYVRKVLERLNMRFSTVMEALVGKLGEEFLLQNTAQNTPGQVTNPGVLLSRIAKLERMEKHLRNSTTRPEFMEILTIEVAEMPSMNEIMKELKLLDQTVSFYEGIDDRRVLPQPIQWVQPLKALVTQLHSQVQNVIQVLNTHTGQEIQKLSNSIKTTFVAKLNDAASKRHEDQVAVEEMARRDSQVVKDLRNLLSAELRFNEFIQTIKTSVARLSFQSVLTPFNANPLPQDLEGNSTLPLQTESWLRKFLELKEAIAQELTEFSRKIQDTKYQLHVQALAHNYTTMQEQHNQTTKAAQDEIVRLQEDLVKQQAEHAEKQKQLEDVHNDVKNLKQSLTAAQELARQAQMNRTNPDAIATKAQNDKLVALVKQTNDQLAETRRQLEADRVKAEQDKKIRDLEQKYKDKLHEQEMEHLKEQNNEKPKKKKSFLRHVSPLLSYILEDD